MELSDEESDYLLEQLNIQLTSIEELAQIDVNDSVKTAAHGVPYSSELSAGVRKDEVEKFPYPDDILEIAPHSEERYFIVPGVKHEDLD
jgi:aspartyl/glutamyl-tRNA(Asn/Gln) amidotransferase C subunit